MGVCGIFPRVRDGAPAEGRERATVTRPLSQEEVTTLVPNDAVRDLLTRVLDWEMMEYSCEENNKSLWEGRIKIPKG